MIRTLALIAAVPLAIALAGCGVHANGTVAPATSVGDGDSDQALKRTAVSYDVDLVVGSVTADPRGPTTAETITLRLVFANLGESFTPYGYHDGVLAYEPILFSVSRDGSTVATGTIEGLTGRDQTTREVVLHDQPPGDKTYHIVIDSDGLIPERDETDNEATVTVLYGGSG